MAALLSRYLDPSGYGLYSYGLSIVSLFALLSNLGMDDLIVRDLTSKPERENKILGTAFIMKLTGNLLAFFAILIFLILSKAKEAELLTIMILSAATIFSSFSVISLSFQALIKARFSVFSNAISSSIVLLIALIFIYSDLDIIAIASLHVIQAALLSVFLLTLYYLYHNNFIDWKFNKTVALTLMKEAWPLALSIALVSIYINCDKIIIKHILGNSQTGNYAVASKLSEAWYFIPTAILASLMPKIVKVKNTDSKNYNASFQQIFNLMVISSIFIAAPITLFSDSIILIIFGEAYKGAADVLVIHIWGCVFVFLGTASGKWMILEGLSKLYFYRSLLGVVINIIGNLILIPKYGISGAAYATILAQFSVVIIFDALATKTRPCFWMKIRSFSPTQWLLTTKAILELRLKKDETL